MRDGKAIYPEFNLETGFEGIIENYWSILQPVHLLMSSCITVKKSLFTSLDLLDAHISTGQDQDMRVRLMMHACLAYSNN